MTANTQTQNRLSGRGKLSAPGAKPVPLRTADEDGLRPAGEGRDAHG